jgi:hypothetical protein
MADVLRAPTYSRVSRQSFISGFIAPNLLLSTLAVVAAVAPFSQKDWQSPQARRQVQAQVVPNLLPLLPAAVTTPFKQSDWSSPFARGRVYVGSSGSQLTLGIPPPPPFAQNDWIGPQAKRPARFDVFPNLLAQFAPVATVPFVQNDWAGPQAKKPPRVEVFPNLLVQLAPVVTPPFAQSDWSAPPPKRLARFDVFPNLVLQVPAVAAPFVQNDWPSVRARVSSFASVFPNVTTRLVPPPPFQQTEWQALKTRKAVVRVIDPPNLPLKTLFVPPPVLPFALRDWPQVYRKPLKYDIAWSNYQLPPRLPIVPVVELPRTRRTVINKVERTLIVGSTYRETIPAARRAPSIGKTGRGTSTTRKPRR